MDILNKAFSQLRDLLRSMSAGSRITAGLLLVLVVVSVAYLFRYQMAGPDVYLLNNEVFSQEELRSMEVAFGKEGLRGWEFDGPRIRIPRGQQGAFLAALAKNDALPQRSGDATQEGRRKHQHVHRQPGQATHHEDCPREGVRQADQAHAEHPGRLRDVRHRAEARLRHRSDRHRLGHRHAQGLAGPLARGGPLDPQPRRLGHRRAEGGKREGRRSEPSRREPRRRRPGRSGGRRAGRQHPDVGAFLPQEDPGRCFQHLGRDGLGLRAA